MSKHRKLIWIPLILAAMIVVKPATGEPARGLKVGDVLGARILETMDSATVPVPADTGLTVVVFWATWSPRSAPALSLWQEYAETYAEKGATFLTVNAEKQVLEAADRSAIAAYIEQQGLTLPVHQDEGLSLFNEIGVVVLPTVLFFRPDGTMTLKYGSFPSSAREDLRAALEKELGIESARTRKDPNRGKLAYQPKNNALLYFNLGRRLEEKGFSGKARPKYVQALEKDPDYKDPLLALEGIFFVKGRTAEAEEALRTFLTDNGLEAQIEKISPPGEAGGAADSPDQAGTAAAVAATTPSAPTGTPEAKPLSPMERMKLMMEKNKE